MRMTFIAFHSCLELKEASWHQKEMAELNFSQIPKKEILRNLEVHILGWPLHHISRFLGGASCFPHSLASMLAYFGTKARVAVGGTAKSRSYATQTSSKPALVWQHSHAATTPQHQAALPKEQLGVAPELIAKMRRLREEAPATFTARRLSANFHLPKKVINSVAPYVRHGKTVCISLECVWSPWEANFSSNLVSLIFSDQTTEFWIL